MADPKNPNLPPDADGKPEPAADGPLEELSLGGPLENLDFSEPSGFNFPAEMPGGEAAEAVPADPSHGEAETTDFVPEFVLPGDEPATAELAAEEAPGAEGMPSAVVEPPEAEAEGEAEAAAEGEEAETAPAPKRRKWLAHVDWVGVALLVIAIWLVVQAVSDNVANVVWTTGYLVLLVLIPFSLWKTRARWLTPQITAVYTVLLAISTAMLLTAIFWLGLELAQYHWDIKAKTRPAVVGAASLLR